MNEYGYAVKNQDSPSRLKSPDYVLRHQTGTCFELSTLLVSFLIGIGYDAYVVSGTASKQCCENDQTYFECQPHLLLQFTDVSETKIEKKKIPEIEKEKLGASKFWMAIDQRKKVERDNRFQEKQKELKKKIELVERIPTDDQYGKRIHSWVLLIINAKEIKFIEPSSGCFHSVSDIRYVAIESIWNCYNYWVNMQSSSSLSKLSFDLTDLDCWEHLLVNEPWHLYGRNSSFSDVRTAKALKHFQMPISWVNKLNISQKHYEVKYPNGEKTISYKKLKIEKFSRRNDNNDIKLRLNMYEDRNMKSRIRVVEIYYERKDKLLKTEINFKNGKIRQTFASGRIDTLKEFEYIKNEKPIWNGMKLKFYSMKRLDNIELVIFQLDEMRIIFTSRTDKIKNYEVKFKIEKSVTNIAEIWNYIEQMTETFNKEQDIDRIFYRFEEIDIQYHYQSNEISHKKENYSKTNYNENRMKILPSNCYESSSSTRHKNGDKNFELLLATEKKRSVEIKNILLEIHKIFESLSHNKDNYY